MMITTTTQSEPIGIRHTKMDIIFETINNLKTRFWSSTPRGYMWIRDNMNHDDRFHVVVDTEYLDELKESMRKDGLNVD